MSAAPTGPLAGLLVADFSRVLAGPYATMMLGDLGAEVIKVESFDGDDTRGSTARANLRFRAAAAGSMSESIVRFACRPAADGNKK